MFFQTLDILGTIAFAISGVLVAMHKRMDAFGVLIIAFVTAVGGGTLRDVLIGIAPVSWMRNMTFVYVILGSAIFAVVFRNQLKHLRKSLFLFVGEGSGGDSPPELSSSCARDYFILRSLGPSSLGALREAWVF